MSSRRTRHKLYAKEFPQWLNTSRVAYRLRISHANIPGSCTLISLILLMMKSVLTVGFRPPYGGGSSDPVLLNLYSWAWTLFALLCVCVVTFLGGVNKVTKCCFTDILCIVYLRRGICSTVLFCKYNVGVTFCCSGAIVAAVCDDFRLVVFSLVVVKSVCLLSIVFNCAVLCLIGK